MLVNVSYVETYGHYVIIIGLSQKLEDDGRLLMFILYKHVAVGWDTCIVESLNSLCMTFEVEVEKIQCKAYLI